MLCFLEGCEALGPGQPSGWLFALYHYKDSSCIVWLVELVELSGVVGFQDITFAKLKEPQLAYVYNLDRIECVCQWSGTAGFGESGREWMKPLCNRASGALSWISTHTHTCSS